MLKSKFVLAIALIAGLLVPFGLIKAEVSEATVNYLRNAGQTAWITQALKAAGQDNLSLSYLDGAEINNANEAAKAILAITAAGQNPYDYQNENYVGRLFDFYNNNQIGSTQLLNDDFWGVLALRAAGEPVEAAAVAGGKNFIMENQNNDGGWAWAPDSESDTNDTAAAIMALLEAGLSDESREIESAVDYLRNVQNNDGGFPFSSGGESDSGSDSWVISALNKLDVNLNSWQKNGHGPVEHLESLALPNGSFKWLAGDEAGNLSMTAFAAVALAGASYPVAVYQAQADEGIHHLRVEGGEATICNAQVEGDTALEILENGAEICGYEYHLQQTDWGPYLDRINNDGAEGQIGWLYRVNWLSPQVGAADYRLETGDEVLFYYADWRDVPLRISLSASNIQPNGQVIATVESFDEQNWNAVLGANVFVGQQTYQTNNSGQASFSIGEEGGFMVYAEKQGAVRSPRQALLVGEGDGSSVILAVNVAQGNNGDEEEQDQGQVAFEINTDSLDFGNMRPGASLERSLTITNQSGHALYLEGVVSGDDLFEENLLLNERIWENYNEVLSQNRSTEVEANLVIPQNYRSGHYQANLIIWGSVR